MAKISQVRKRDGSFEDFDKSKIKVAVEKALEATGHRTSPAVKISNQVAKTLEEKFGRITPSVEDIQDVVEETLMKNGLSDVARAYILYREKRKDIRDFKTFMGVRDELDLTQNAITVLAKRYLLKDDEGNIVETPGRMMKRVAKAVARADQAYEKGAAKKTQEVFYDMLSSLDFLPNSPTLMNAGTELGQLSACFVLPVEDSLDSIFTTLKDMALIHKSGGGTGFDFSSLRPEGDIVKSTKGVASGPVSFMAVYDKATDVVKQGGKRRGANMGNLRHDHPDLMEFVNVKAEGELQNFNVSVTVSDEFMRAVRDKKDYFLVNPRDGKKVEKVSAGEVFDTIVHNAWRCGDPGLVFIDEINRRNPTRELGLISATNPCGEQPLHPFESCNLGSINLRNFVKSKKVDYKRLKKVVHNAVHFLDNVIDVNKYPLEEIEDITKKNRRIGLGVMGFAEMLILLGIPYDSQKALDTADELMKFINAEARKKSKELAKKRGDFPNVDKSVWKQARNATVTTIAPTGTISIIAGVSSGIEPLFAVSYVRNVLEGAKLLETNGLFERVAKDQGFFSKDLMMRIARTGSVKDVKGVPKNVQRLFRIASEIKTDWHIRMQAVFQKHCENAVSKTVNMPEKASQKDVADAYLLAHKLKCKGITVYRYGSKESQVLEKGESFVFASEDYAGGEVCRECAH